jgi:hypothetical protein
MQTARWVMTAVSMMLVGVLAQQADAAGPQGAQMRDHASFILAAAVADQTEINSTQATLRDLWIGHVFWVRNVVVAELAGDAPAQKVAEEQVVANAQSIAASIEPFYGTEAKEKLLTLLAGHYGAVSAYLNASVANSDAMKTEATSNLIGNAEEIASFLSSANPYLPKDTVDGLLQAHGSHHIAQIQQLQAKDYAGEAQTWADMSQHMYVIADAIADALAKQFPARF